MKNLFISALLITAVCFSAKAQTVSFGPTVGFGNSWLTNTGNTVAFKPSPNVGITFVYSSTNHWGLGADMKFSAEGVRHMYAVGTVNYNNILRLNYIRIPLSAYYFFGTDKNAVRPKIALGPTLGFLTGSTYVVRDNNGNEISSTNNTANLHTFDFGMHFSAGVNFRLADRIWLNTDFTYYQGLVPVNINGNTNLNGNLGMNVGLAFGLGK